MQNPCGRRVNDLALAAIDTVAAAVYSDEPEVEGVIFFVFQHLQVGPDLPRVGGFVYKRVIEDDFSALEESVFDLVVIRFRAGNQGAASGLNTDDFRLVWKEGKKGNGEIKAHFSARQMACRDFKCEISRIHLDELPFELFSDVQNGPTNQQPMEEEEGGSCSLGFRSISLRSRNVEPGMTFQL